MRSLSRTLLIAYLIVLLWLVLFKFSNDIVSVLTNYQTRSLNVIPFADYSRVSPMELIYNCIVFIPFGLLLGVNFKRIAFFPKLTSVLILSLSAEIAQFVFAIGATDITDVIMNTFGGFIGLIAYIAANKYIDSKKLDLCIVVAGAMVLILFVLLRTLVFKVRYQ